MGRLQPGYPLWLRAHWIGMKLQFPLQKIGLRSSARHRISEPVSPLRLYPARLSGAGAVLYSLGIALALGGCEERGSAPPAPRVQQIVINEVMAENDTTVADDLGEYSDWIELKNIGTVAIDLADTYLSDVPEEPTLWAIDTSLSLLPGERFVIWADDRGSGRHAAFRLSSKGELLSLSLEEDGAVHPLDQVEFPALGPDSVYARIPDGTGDWTQAAIPTPGEMNQ